MCSATVAETDLKYWCEMPPKGCLMLLCCCQNLIKECLLLEHCTWTILFSMPRGTLWHI